MSKFCVKAAILFSLAIAEQVSTTAKPVATQGGTSENLSVSVSTPAPEASQESGFRKAFKKLKNAGNKFVNPLEIVKRQVKNFEEILDKIDESGGIPEAAIKRLDDISSKIEPPLSILGLLSPKFAKTIDLFKQKVKQYKDGAKDKKDEVVRSLETIKDKLKAGLTQLDKLSQSGKDLGNIFKNFIPSSNFLRRFPFSKDSDQN